MAKKFRQVGVFVDFTKYPELYEALLSLADEQYIKPPALIRQIVGAEIQSKNETNPQRKNRAATSTAA